LKGNGFAPTTLTCPKLMPSSGCATFSHPMGEGHLPIPRARKSFQPVNFDFLFQRLEFRVAGDEFMIFCQRGKGFWLPKGSWVRMLPSAQG
jgi:hypothetical protein